MFLYLSDTENKLKMLSGLFKLLIYLHKLIGIYIIIYACSVFFETLCKKYMIIIVLGSPVVFIAAYIPVMVYVVDLAPQQYVVSICRIFI